MKLIVLIITSMLFFLTHVGLSHGSFREALVKKLTLWGFRGFYSLVSFATLGVAIWMMAIMEDADKGQFFWSLPFYLLPLAYIPIVLGILLVASSPVTPSPTGMMPAPTVVKGVLKITRHPVNMGIAFWALGHLIANGNLGDIFFFGSIFATGFLGAFHQDLRKAREGGDDFFKFKSETSILPFAAVITGKNKLERSDLSIPALAGAVVAIGIILYFHKFLFGETPW